MTTATRVRRTAISPALMDEVWLYISRHHCGQATAVKEAALAAILGLSSRRLQQVLQSLANDREKPIVTSCRKPYGVYVPVTPQEMSDYAKQIQRRIISLARRLRAVTRTPLVRVQHQTEIFPETHRDPEAN